jgi:hypothetical protein
MANLIEMLNNPKRCGVFRFSGDAGMLEDRAAAAGLAVHKLDIGAISEDESDSDWKQFKAVYNETFKALFVVFVAICIIVRIAVFVAIGTNAAAPGTAPFRTVYVFADIYSPFYCFGLLSSKTPTST